MYQLICNHTVTRVIQIFRMDDMSQKLQLHYGDKIHEMTHSFIKWVNWIEY